MLAMCCMPPDLNNGIVTLYGFLGGLVGLLLLFLTVFIFNLFRAPCKQRNEAREELKRLQESLGDIGYLESFMWEVFEDVSKLKYYQSRGAALDNYDLTRYQNWHRDVSEWLQQNIYSETINWHHDVNIPLEGTTLDDVIKAYEAGYAILRELQKSIALVVRKEGSQSQ